MARPRKDDLPAYLELNKRASTYYYRNPGMERKQNLGKDRKKAVELAEVLNADYRIELAEKASRLQASETRDGKSFEEAFCEFVEKYIVDYRLKVTTARLLKQRQERLVARLGKLPTNIISTQMLREAIAASSEFEQTKMKTLLLRFFQYAKSTGLYPNHIGNPVDDLYSDPVPMKRRQRMTLDQFNAIYQVAPEWLRCCMLLSLHLALRRVDLVNLRFDDVIGNRIISPIRKTDSDSRDIEATSVDFPIHPEVGQAIAKARISALKTGMCPFVVHRQPERITKRLSDALMMGTMEHVAQITPQYATKAFNKARAIAAQNTALFEGLEERDMPTLHEIRSLSSYLYAKAGYEIESVQDLMAHTDPDMTRYYQKGHARKILRIDMQLPFGVLDPKGIREPRPAYSLEGRGRQKKFSENFLNFPRV